MATNNEQRPIRLRPRRSKGNPNDDPRRYVGVLGSLLRFVQMARRQPPRRGHSPQSLWHSGSNSPSPRLYGQRVAVQVTYAKNKNPGQWKAHGHYIARDTATQESSPSRAGFDATRTGINIASALDTWQRAGDERIFKIIVSPEFGERLNLQDQTRRLVERMQQDLGTRLEWVAAVHFNTEHPHIHIAVRARDQTGPSVRLARDYIRSGIRHHAEDLATEALGFRTERDCEEAQRREITQNRFTTLDRIIQRWNDGQSSWFLISADIANTRFPEREWIRQENLSARLAYLEKMGLARSVASQKWVVQTDFDRILRTFQQLGDRQKMLTAHGALLSDPGLPFEITHIRNLTMLEGRVLLHAGDERSGRRYLLLEGTDAKVHLIDHTDRIEDARRVGELPINRFVRLEKNFPNILVSDYGNAHKLLENDTFFKKRAQLPSGHRIAADQKFWRGWLGQYYARLNAAVETERALERPQKRSLS